MKPKHSWHRSWTKEAWLVYSCRAKSFLAFLFGELSAMAITEMMSRED